MGLDSENIAIEKVVYKNKLLGTVFICMCHYFLFHIYILNSTVYFNLFCLCGGVNYFIFLNIILYARPYISAGRMINNCLLTKHSSVLSNIFILYKTHNCAKLRIFREVFLKNKIFILGHYASDVTVYCKTSWFCDGMYHFQTKWMLHGFCQQ